MSDRTAVALLVLSFATLLTTHVALARRLARRLARGRGLVAFFAFPLAPWWAWREKMHRWWTLLWVAAAACYGVALVFACRR